MTTQIVFSPCLPNLHGQMRYKRKLSDTDQPLYKKKRGSSKKLKRSKSSKAPINTTQFLMNDTTSPSSDWERFNSSDSEDEVVRNGFGKKEFSKEYSTVECSKYSQMSKLDLIQEYLAIENKVHIFDQKYRTIQMHQHIQQQKQQQQQQQQQQNNVLQERQELRERQHRHRQLQQQQQHRSTACRPRRSSSGTFNPDILEKIRIFQSEIEKLNRENAELEGENKRLMAENASSLYTSSSSPTDSSRVEAEYGSFKADESCCEDDDSSILGETSSTDESSFETDEGWVKNGLEDNRKDDTGYESDGSERINFQVSSST